MTMTHFKVFLMLVCILSPQTTKGVHGQCSMPPENQAFYEGAQNTVLTCNSPTKVSYTIKPSSDPLGAYTITNYDDTVATAYKNLYAVNQSGLIIKIDQGNAAVPPISTAGLYIINPNGTNRVGAKLVVVREPPTCKCTPTNSAKINLTCSLTYADSTYQPINAKMTWTSNGKVVKNDLTPVKTLKNLYYVSTSLIIIDAYDAANYQCTVTFTNAKKQFTYVATNAPVFSASCTSPFCGLTTRQPATITTTKKMTTAALPVTTSRPLKGGRDSGGSHDDSVRMRRKKVNAQVFSASCTSPCDECLSKLKNLAVHEGQLNTVLNLATDPTNVSWKVIPTSDELDTDTIINYGGVKNSAYTGLYEVNQTGLLIKNATISGKPISTAGLYIGQCANNPNRTGAKLLVVLKGPKCSRISIDETTSNVSCEVTYGDSSYNPIYPIVTWKLNGVVLSSSTLTRRKVNPLVFYAESTITAKGDDIYTCELTFAEPTDIQFPFVATNAPKFKESCSACH